MRAPFHVFTSVWLALFSADDLLVGTMKDPQTDEERCPRPEWLINIGVCTHLGCIPTEGGNYHGWFCPCHGSHYDISGKTSCAVQHIHRKFRVAQEFIIVMHAPGLSAGRVRQGPAPTNLELPPTVFLDDTTVKLG